MNTLPSVAGAKLPRTYEAAKTALQKCSKVDECKDWKDKAAALASYAKQSKDDSLHKMALRIQARAIQRCGQLLEKIEKEKGGGRHSGEPRPSARKRAADEAGLSEHERKTALRIAGLPAEQFEQQVESDNPPTIGDLAQQGTAKKPTYLGDRTPEEFQAATGLLGLLSHIVRVAGQLDLPLALRGLDAGERRQASTQIPKIIEFIQQVEKGVSDGEKNKAA